MLLDRRRLHLIALAFAIVPALPARGEDARLNTLSELSTHLGRCWRSPALPAGSRGMQITVRLSFKRSGEILGQPRITFESGDAPDELRITYRTAVMEALQRCSPLPISDELGGAIAGRPFTMRFDDRRDRRPTI